MEKPIEDKIYEVVQDFDELILDRYQISMGQELQGELATLIYDLFKKEKTKISILKKELLTMIDKPKPMTDIVAWNYAIAFTIRMLDVLQLGKTLSDLNEEEVNNIKGKNETENL